MPGVSKSLTRAENPRLSEAREREIPRRGLPTNRGAALRCYHFVWDIADGPGDYVGGHRISANDRRLEGVLP
jgi:hypothetical protein